MWLPSYPEFVCSTTLVCGPACSFCKLTFLQWLLCGGATYVVCGLCAASAQPLDRWSRVALMLDRTSRCPRSCRGPLSRRWRRRVEPEPVLWQHAYGDALLRACCFCYVDCWLRVTNSGVWYACRSLGSLWCMTMLARLRTSCVGSHAGVPMQRKAAVCRRVSGLSWIAGMSRITLNLSCNVGLNLS